VFVVELSGTHYSYQADTFADLYRAISIVKQRRLYCMWFKQCCLL